MHGMLGGGGPPVYPYKDIPLVLSRVAVKLDSHIAEGAEVAKDVCLCITLVSACEAPARLRPGGHTVNIALSPVVGDAAHKQAARVPCRAFTVVHPVFGRGRSMVTSKYREMKAGGSSRYLVRRSLRPMCLGLRERRLGLRERLRRSSSAECNGEH